MRARRLLGGLLAAALLTVTACDGGADESEALPPLAVVDPPAASGGGACVLWDYTFIEQMTGVRFTVAAGKQVGETATCVVQTEAGPAPALVLTVSSSSADADLFTDKLKPEKATTVKLLGLAAYRLEKRGSVEVAWLSEGKQLQSLKFLYAGAADQAMGDRLVAMAKVMTSTDGARTKKT